MIKRKVRTNWKSSKEKKEREKRKRKKGKHEKWMKMKGERVMKSRWIPLRRNQEPITQWWPQR